MKIGRAETLIEVGRKGNVVWYRWVVGYAYPRSGNAHNPTPRYVYERHENGQLIDSSDHLRSLKY